MSSAEIVPDEAPSAFGSSEQRAQKVVDALKLIATRVQSAETEQQLSPAGDNSEASDASRMSVLKLTDAVKASIDARKAGIDYRDPPKTLSPVFLSDLPAAERQGYLRGRAETFIDEISAAYELGKTDSDADNASIIIEQQGRIDALEERLARHEDGVLDYTEADVTKLVELIDGDEQLTVRTDTE